MRGDKFEFIGDSGMEKIQIDIATHSGLTIMIFAEGTMLKPKSWLSLYNHKSYVPIGNAVNIINSWWQQGANIIYCTSRKKKRALDIANILREYGFCGRCLVSRGDKERYAEIAEELRPDILIEDDCKSIGGTWQTCIHRVKAEIKQQIKSIVVSEFKGIDHLPADISNLMNL